MNYKCSKLKLRVFLAGHIVAMVTYSATILTATYFPMIVQFVDTMMLLSTSIEWLLSEFSQLVSFLKNKFAFSDPSFTNLAAARWQDLMSRGQKS